MTMNNLPPEGGTYETPLVPDERFGEAPSGDTASVTEVVGTAKEEAAGVAREVKGQAKDLYRQTTAELQEQAATQQRRVAEGLRTVGDQLGSMAANAEQGVASDVVGQVSTRVSSVADWLDARDPGSLLGEVRSYAARRPGTFIAIAALSGVLVGRLTRSLVDEAKDEASDSDTTGAKHVAGEPL